MPERVSSPCYILIIIIIIIHAILQHLVARSVDMPVPVAHDAAGAHLGDGGPRLQISPRQMTKGDTMVATKFPERLG